MENIHYKEPYEFKGLIYSTRPERRNDVSMICRGLMAIELLSFNRKLLDWSCSARRRKFDSGRDWMDGVVDDSLKENRPECL